jgi:hypothetical protein
VFEVNASANTSSLINTSPDKNDSSMTESKSANRAPDRSSVLSQEELAKKKKKNQKKRDKLKLKKKLQK